MKIPAILIAELIVRVNKDVARLVPLIRAARALRAAHPDDDLPVLADSLDRSDHVGDQIDDEVRAWFAARGRDVPN